MAPEVEGESNPAQVASAAVDTKVTPDVPVEEGTVEAEPEKEAETEAEADEGEAEEEPIENPWNAVCVLGLRVYSKQAGATVEVSTQKKDAAAALLEVDNVTAAGATT